MFSQKIINYINETMPELRELQLSIGGKALFIGGYEMLNALLIQNNVLDETDKSIAIFHPGSDLLDVYMLVIMGIAAYKQTILNNAKLKLKDFILGELVEYNGKIVRYGGISYGEDDNIERFQISYDDKYNTSKQLPLHFFSGVSKYVGTKTNADKYEGKGAKIEYKDALRALLRVQEEHIDLSGYSTFLISSERSRLLGLLNEVAINGTPFFDMFPSVKCTTANSQRLGRDRIQRSSMFYFVSSLSTADDIMRAESKIRTLFIDARGKSLNDGTLLASIRNQYQLEDIFWLQTYNKLDSVDKLDGGLGFKIWIWDKSDYIELAELQKDSYIPTSITTMADIHNVTPSRIANYADLPIEIPYPEGITLELHSLIQNQIHEMFSLSNDYGSTDLQKFSIHVAGVALRIFQSSLPISQIDIINNSLEKRTFDEEIMFLRESIRILIKSPLPEDFETKAVALLSNLEVSISAFSEYYGKCDQAVSIIIENPNRNICVFTNPKYPSMSSTIKEIIISKLNNNDHQNLSLNIDVSDNMIQAITNHDIIIWMFKPANREFLMLEAGVEKNFILLYPLQKKEFERTILYNIHRFQRYSYSDYRADLLKIPPEMLESTIKDSSQAETEAFDLEKLLSTTMAKVLNTYSDGSHAELVGARMVLFSDGTHALFQTGNKIKVLDLEHETVETKTVGSLSEGDQVAFLKDSKRTVFEELVEFYQHKPEIIELVELSELWRKALLAYRDAHFFHPVIIKKMLAGAGLVRHVTTIENWLDGATICPDEDNYAPVNIIAQVTNNTELKEHLEEVKEAARKIHALRIKIGRYLAKRLTQSYISPDSIIDDPILKNRLDEISSHVQVARVSLVNEEILKVPADITNKLLSAEDM